MSELVQKGIEQAADDMRLESDEAIWQEGVLRHVPIVGSIYNWISPLQKVKKKWKVFSNFFQNVKLGRKNNIFINYFSR